MRRIDDRGYWEGAVDELPYGQADNLNRWIPENLGPDRTVPVYDFGCGRGHVCKALYDAGWQNVTGFEGCPLPTADLIYTGVVRQDITQPFRVARAGHVVTLEVLEHIPEQYQDAALANIADACAPGCRLIASWAERGQPGLSHVNCVDNYEAIARIQPFGFRLLEAPTRDARLLDHGHCEWFAKTTLVFARVR